MSVVSALTLAPGEADAVTFVMREPLSFWGGFDAATGRIVDRRHPQAGMILSGRVLVMTSGRGSSSGSSVLAEAIRLGTGPAGIVLLSRDAIVMLGALVAGALYDLRVPVVLANGPDWAAITAAERIAIDAGEEAATLTLTRTG